MSFTYVGLLYFSAEVYLSIAISRSHNFFAEFIESASQIMSVK